MKTPPGASVAAGASPSRVSRAVVLAFCAYAFATFLLTHWPKLRLPNPVVRSDIIAHMTVFGLWTILAVRCGWFGPAFSRRNLWLTGIVAAVYAGIDEGLQAIPFLNRTAALDDYAANVLGVVTGTLTMAAYTLLVTRRAARMRRDSTDVLIQPSSSDTLAQ